MSVYVDASAFMKLYVEEPESDSCGAILQADPHWFSARHTVVEVRRNLWRRFSGPASADARGQFDRDWARTNVLELDAATCDAAARIAELTCLRTLDALHLGAAGAIAESGDVSMLTYDVRQAEAARSFGWTVLGA
ncbi:MAG TPA: type II toxin-antitoxin system VapC family toxin [Actinomycetota bacterium]|nr:type II toxin-antitoxin system VapC family toxin [Actinomycetota bacterium]